MGAKESRIGFLSYDEAVRRVTDVELKRLKDAFKRTSGLSAYMTQQCFYKEVLGDGVPPKVAEVIYNSFGGTPKGLHFNNLIVGLVLLTRGRDEEKAKYIFSLFASDSGSYVVREEVESRLHAVDGEVPPSLRKCFLEVRAFQAGLQSLTDALALRLISNRQGLNSSVHVNITSSNCLSGSAAAETPALPISNCQEISQRFTRKAGGGTSSPNVPKQKQEIYLLRDNKTQIKDSSL